MTNLETVDAKIDRARLQLRRLRAVVAGLCSERARLIVREEFENGERWVHRGGEPAMPVRWSVAVGKFVHNLRSALGHLVWQLAAARGDCAGRHGGDTWAFPVDAYFDGSSGPESARCRAATVTGILTPASRARTRWSDVPGKSCRELRQSRHPPD